MTIEGRAKIVHSTWRLMATRGLEAVTFRNVADDAGVSVGRVQHHFGTREGLLLSSCTAMVDGAYDSFRAQTSSSNAYDGFESLWGMFCQQLRSLARGRPYGTHSSPHPSPARESQRSSPSLSAARRNWWRG